MEGPLDFLGTVFDALQRLTGLLHPAFTSEVPDNQKRQQDQCDHERDVHFKGVQVVHYDDEGRDDSGDRIQIDLDPTFEFSCSHRMPSVNVE